MLRDISLVFLSFIAGVATFLLLAVHTAWIALTYVLRRRGCKVTYLQHDWTKVKASIATVQSPEERKKYERWEVLLHYTYTAWAVAMGVFVLVVLFIYS